MISNGYSMTIIVWQGIKFFLQQSCVALFCVTVKYKKGKVWILMGISWQ